MKVCFSYIRFSSEGQREGTSLERQSEIAPQIAKEKGWTLRNDLNAQDLGVSAFKGHNIETLEAIIQSAKDGKIPQGSVMIIEAFDRFSRANLSTAEDLMKKVLQAGIEIYIHRGSHHLTAESLEKPMDRIIALLELAAANEYSAKLSDRLKKAHQSKRNRILNGEKVKITLPSWIDKDFKLNGKVAVIRSIFSSYLMGVGPGTIAKNFNLSKTQTLSERGVWGQGVVYKMLSNRQVIGEYDVNGEAVKGYFPAAISEETFMKVQTKLNDNRGKNATTNPEGKITNIFAGVIYCACGSLAKVSSGKSVKCLDCYGRIKGLGCNHRMTKYATFESSFIKLMTVRASDLVQDESGNTANNHIQILKGQLTETEKKIANITEALTIGFNKSLVLKLGQLETEAEEIKSKIQLESAKTVSVKGSSDKLNKIVSRLGDITTDNDLRVMVKGWVRENCNRITVNTTTKEYTVDLKNGNFVKMNFAGEVLECRSFVSLFSGSTVQDTVSAVKTA